MNKPDRTITVTGASGFVGRVLVERLLQEKNLHVRCLVRPGSQRSALEALAGDLSFCEGDITRPDTLVAAMEGAWGVVNLAGYREFRLPGCVHSCPHPAFRVGGTVRVPTNIGTRG